MREAMPSPGRLRTAACQALLVTLTAVLTGCGGVKMYLHDLDDPGFRSGGGKPLPGITMEVGETRRAIKQSFGVMSIGGGYRWGLVSDKPDVVSVEYREEGRHTTVMLVAHKPGTARLYHINRLSGNQLQDDDWPGERAWFEVKVTETDGDR